MDGLRAASRYLLAILVTFLLTRHWLDARPGDEGRVVRAQDGRRGVPPRPRPAPGAAEAPALPTPAATAPYQEPDAPRPAIPAELLRLSDADEQINIRVYAAANKGVVNITSATSRQTFFGDETTSSGSGSGFVINKQGHILTNYHVVEGADTLEVKLPDGSSREAEVVGTDASTDVAVIHVEVQPGELEPLPLGDSGPLKVGQKVLAIGNPFGLERTLTTGIISSLDRSIQAKNGRTIKGIIQTDAAINPGNSGGPLLNPRGEVIGMNTAILSQVGQSAGIGFAVPIASIKRILRPLIEQGRVTRGDLGITRVYRTDEGLLVLAVQRGGPADEAGIRPLQVRQFRRGNAIITKPDLDSADVIVAVDGKPVRTSDEILAEVEVHPPGSKVTLSVVRGAKSVEVPVTLGGS